MKTITAIILARKGSKRIPNKNFRSFCGKSLLEWAILIALRSKLIEKIFVSTDEEEFEFRHDNVVINRRPSSLAQDDTSPGEVIRYLRKEYDLRGSLVLLDPCSPFRTQWILDKVIKKHHETQKTVVTVREGNYDPNGVAYAFTTDSVWDSDEEIISIVMNNELSIHIDHVWQFRIAEYRFRRLGYAGYL